MRLLVCFALLVAGCGNEAGGRPTDMAGARSDLLGAGPDLAAPGADLAGGAQDFAGADLIGYSGLGDPCGGFVGNPKRCLPPLVCQPARIPDLPGTCAFPDAGACVANGGTCQGNSDCCSMNCIIRGALNGFCCQPGGCP